MITAINYLIAAVITTLLILTSSFIFLLFSSNEDGYRTSYFGSLFFSSTTSENDSVALEFGVASGLPIFITIALFFVIYLFLVQLFKKTRPKS